MSAPDGRRARNDTSEARPAGSGPGTSGTDYYAHPTAVIDAGAVIGKGTKIWHFCHVMPGAVIGERCVLGQNVVVMPGTKIGTNVKIQNNVSIYEGVELEDDVFCGPSMVFTNVTFPRSHVIRKGEYERTLCQKGATIGANATVLCGSTLGRFAFVGAGAVVTKDVKSHALVVGNPAKQVGWMCQCGERLKLTKGKGTCARCGSRWAERGGALVPP